MMKKIFNYILIFVFVFVVGVGVVQAKKITIEKVVDNLGENFKEQFKQFAGEAIDEMGAVYYAELQSDKILLKQKINDEITVLSEMDYKDEIITHTYIYDENANGDALIVSYLYISLFKTIGGLHGYEENELQSLFATIGNAKFSKDGYEIISSKDENENQKTIFKIDINAFDENGKEISDNVDNENNNDEDKITFVVPKEKLESITTKEIAEKLPSVLKKIYIEQFGELVEDTSNFSVEYDYNTITIYQEIDKKVEMLRTLTINDGIITHEYIYDTELGIDGERIVNVFIYKGIFMTIGEIYGYSENELKFLYSEFFEATFDEYGYEFTSTKEKSNFRIDINRFNLKKEVEEVPDKDVEINNNTATDIDNEENSNSSTVFIIMIIIVIVSLCLLFYINRDMFGNMLRNKFRR